MRKRLAITVLCGVVVGGGCASKPPAVGPNDSPTTMPSPASLVGTWRMISVTEPNGKIHPVEQPFFMRFYPDGKAASWPTPVAPVSRGEYQVIDGQLVLPDVSSKPCARLEVTDRTMRYWTDEAACLYHRVSPDLEPGHLP